MRRIGAGGTRRGRPGSGRDRWLASWRFALRLGRREVRRRPGHSALIAALVATPVLLITAFLTFFTSQDISQAEGIDRDLGSAAAAVSPATGPFGFVSGVGQSVDAAEAKVTPGYAASDPWDTERIVATVGSPVVRLGRTGALVEGDATDYGQDDGRTSLQALVLDGPPGGVTESLATLRSGRWPQAAGEVLVTPAGVTQGVPESGPVSLVLGQDEEATGFQVVGVGEAAYSSANNASLVLPAAAAPAATSWQWLVERTEPVRVAEAQEWALHGLDVSSREVLLNPPPDQDWQAENATRLALFYSMIGLAVLVETVLLAGPAFAVSAARQRHSLALAGAQGAARADVRRAVIAYGLVLAVLATVTAALVGAALGLGGATVLARLRPGQHVQLELPWLWVGLLVAASVVAAGVAAWWPARGATRLDIMSVLRGQVVSGRVGRGRPAVGGALVLAGVVALVVAMRGLPHQATPWTFAGAILLGLGSMLLVPAVLALVSRVSGGAPLPWRLAARDSMRQRSRAVPAVLAIVAAVAVMAATATVQASASANEERQYTLQVPLGTITVEPGADRDITQAVTDAVADVLPDATAYPLTWIHEGPGMDEMTGQPVDRPVQAVVPASCGAEDLTMSWDNAESSACYLEVYDRHAVVPVEALERTGALTSPMRDVLGAGGLIVWEHPVEGQQSTTGPGEAQAVTAAARATGQEGGAEMTGPATLTPVPVYRATAAEMDALRVSGTHSSGYLTTQTADRLGWAGEPGSVFIAQDGELTPDDAAALEGALAEQNPYVYLERGFVPDPTERIVTLVTLGVFSLIALAAVVISTALTITEGQRDSATLAAIGGTRRTRRLLAAVHALLVGAVGVLLGTALGLVIGGAMSWTTTQVRSYSQSYEGWSGDGGVVAVPWTALGLAAVAIPAIAAAVAWISVRRAPTMTHAVG